MLLWSRDGACAGEKVYLFVFLCVFPLFYFSWSCSTTHWESCRPLGVSPALLLFRVFGGPHHHPFYLFRVNGTMMGLLLSSGEEEKGLCPPSHHEVHRRQKERVFVCVLMVPANRFCRCWTEESPREFRKFKRFKQKEKDVDAAAFAPPRHAGYASANKRDKRKQTNEKGGVRNDRQGTLR